MEIDVKLLMELDADQLLERLAQEGWSASRDPEDYNHSGVGYFTSCERIQGELKKITVSPDDDFDLRMYRSIDIVYLEHDGHKRIVQVNGQESMTDMAFADNPFSDQEDEFPTGLPVYNYQYQLGLVETQVVEQAVEPTLRNWYNSQITVEYITNIHWLDEMGVIGYYLGF